MAFIDWNDSLSVGIDKFDREHQKLVEITNTLYEAMTKGQGKEVLGNILSELIEYTQTHFANEEKAMAEAGFDGLEEHRGEHEKLVKLVLDLKKEYEEDKVTVTSDILTFLSNWLTSHIQGTDKKYSGLLKE